MKYGPGLINWNSVENPPKGILHVQCVNTEIDRLHHPWHPRCSCVSAP